MANGITLSAGVRANLLSLQNTAQLMQTTQNRLATGKKVNSALDNPLNFFTSQSLQSRAGDLNSLLDSMSNGIQTIQAANNGLTSITSTVQSMQSTLNQALQDKSFQTASYNLSSSATGSISFNAGSVGTTPVSVALATNTGGTPAAATAAAVTGTTDFGATSAAVTGSNNAADQIDASGGAITFDVAVDGGAAVTVTLATNGGANSDGIYTAADITTAINAALTADSQTVTATASFNATHGLVLTSDSAGATSSVTVSDGTAGDATGIGFTDGAPASTATGVAAGIDASGGAISFDIAVDGGDAVTVTLATNGGTGNNGFYSASDITTAINAALTADGQSATVAATINGTTGGLVLTSGSTGVTSSVTVTDGASGDATDIGFTSGAAASTSRGAPAGFTGGTNVLKTVDALVTEINANASLTGKIVASNDNGKLRIQNISTSALTVTGASATSVDGSSSQTTINGNDVRKGLVQQFNTLRDQLDKFADDASYNGVNLLHGDNLKLTLNETGTSALNIQAKDANGNVLAVNSTSLGIASSTNAEFDSDATLNTKLDSLTKALSTLRSQASSFGSNLSVVQNRQNFTKSMINTLQTGGDNLILADTNEEGANLLALQTRQSLSTTALSLSAQADQAVLSLFG